MTYTLEFDEWAFKEWQKLGDTIKAQFKKKLTKILQNPHITANRLSGEHHLYKIKLRSAGYRLVYQVEVFVIVVGKREKKAVYELAQARLGKGADEQA